MQNLCTFKKNQTRLSIQIFISIIVILALFTDVSPAYAASFTVDHDSDSIDANPGDGICADLSGYCTLRAAIMETNALPGSDTIYLPADTYNLSLAGFSEDNCAQGDLDILDSLTITGANASTTFVDGNDLDRVFHIISSTASITVKLENITIRDGAAPLGYFENDFTNEPLGCGGGVLVQDYEPFGSEVQIINCAIADNTAAEGAGGGLYYCGWDCWDNSYLEKSSGSLIMQDTIVQNNTSDYHGGGVVLSRLSIGELNRVSFLANSTDTTHSLTHYSSGGGLYAHTTYDLRITHSTFESNFAGSGGGVAIGDTDRFYPPYFDTDPVDAIFYSCTFNNNEATANQVEPSADYGLGGAIYESGVNSQIINSTFSSNHAKSGGAYLKTLNFYYSITDISYSTFINNYAEDYVGSVLCGGEGAGEVSLSTSIFYNNTDGLHDPGPAGIFLSDIQSAGYNLFNNFPGGEHDEEEFFPADPTDLVDFNPMLGPLANTGGYTRTHALQFGSPALNYIPSGVMNCGDVTFEDQRGEARTGTYGDALCEIGAWEAQSTDSGFAGPDEGDDVDSLPATGFPPFSHSHLVPMPTGINYTETQILLEIPKLNQKLEVVGVPYSKNGWDVQWLGRQVGWLEGTSYPTWKGNTVMTAHVYDAEGEPGPFVNLNELKWGDQVILHAWGKRYIYEVREVQEYVSPNDTSPLSQTENNWLTLITCKGYDESNQSYLWRVVVKAVELTVEN